jgi:hypothetical protein
MTSVTKVLALLVPQLLLSSGPVYARGEEAASRPTHGAEVHLLSVMGNVTLDGGPLEGPRRLPPDALLVLGSASVVQLLLPGKESSVGPAGQRQERILPAVTAASIGGAARLRLVQGTRLVFRGDGAARVAGTGFILEVDGWTVEPWHLGGAVLVHGHRVHALQGQIFLYPPAASTLDPVGRLARRLFSGEPSAVQMLAAGQVARLGLDGRLSVQPAGAPDPAVLRALETFQPPPAWRPEIRPVTVAEVRRAAHFTELQRQTERETASCGCTESRGSGSAPFSGGGPQLNPLETTQAGVRIRVTGLPRVVP